MALPNEMWALIIEFSDNPKCVFVCKLWNELSRKPRINKGYYPNGKHHIYEKMGNLENCELSTRGFYMGFQFTMENGLNTIMG